MDVASLVTPAGDAVRLFEALRGTGHHLLLLEGVDPGPGEPLRALAGRTSQDFGRHVESHLVARRPPTEPWPGNGRVLLDPDGEMHHRYGARSACLYLIRPDGYVGFRSLPPDGRRLEKYLKTLFVRGRAGWASAYIERLRRGEAVEFRPPGHSMHGRIEPGQSCTVVPLGSLPLEVGDIVLCEVRGKQYLHAIAATDGKRYQIADARGTINGWTGRGKIYGKCTGVK